MPFDLDEIFAYTTVKTVMIKDRWLGLLHYGAMIGIFIYIVVFTVVINHGYLFLESPVGNARFSFRRPYVPFSNTVNPSPLADLQYCKSTFWNVTQATIETGDGCPTIVGTTLTYPNLRCVYWDEDDSVFPTSESNAIMLTTRVSSQVYVLPNCTLDEPSCVYVPAAAEDEFYVADTESYTLLIDHAMRAPISGKQRNGKFIDGRLLGENGKPFDTSNFEKGVEYIAYYNETLDTYFPTVLKLQTILEAAGLNSLDRPSDAVANCDETVRYAGLVLVLFIRYDNTFSFKENRIRYTLQFQALAETEYKVNEQVLLNPTFNNVTGDVNVFTSLNLNRHGVRIVAVILGEIGHFEFQVLLLTLVSGLGLMAVSTLIVDFLATTVLPRKQMYDVYKTQHTVDFSDLQKGNVSLPPDVEFEKKQRYPESSTSDGL